MSYPITQNFIPNLPQNAYRNGSYEGVVAHSTADPEAPAINIRNYESTHYNDGFVHFAVDWTSIIQISDTTFSCWGCGHNGNPRFCQVELCETSDPNKFKESYARYTWLLAKLLFDRKLGVTHQVTIWTHNDVTHLLGGTDHTDPVAYLQTHGISIAQLIADVTNEYNQMGNVQPPQHLYRIRVTWEDAKSQVGAFASLDSAKTVADQNKANGCKVFDDNGNVVYDPNPQPQTVTQQHLFRVRKDWTDVKGQIGAFSVLDSAKTLADNNAGYKVFDESGNVVYTPNVQPVPQSQPTPVAQPTPTPKPIEVDHTGHHDILANSDNVAEKMVSFVKSVNPVSQDIEEIAKQFIEVGNKYGIRGDIAFCQSIIETGYFKFDGGTAVTPDQHNYAGIGVTSKGMKGNSFNAVKDGVTAQMQHLYAYASTKELPTGEIALDPRYQYVTRGIAPHWEDLNNHWAMNDQYGQEILAVYDKLVAFNYVPPVVAPVVETHIVVPAEPVVSSVESVPSVEVKNDTPQDSNANISQAKTQNVIIQIIEFILVKLKDLFGMK